VGDEQKPTSSPWSNSLRAHGTIAEIDEPVLLAIEKCVFKGYQIPADLSSRCRTPKHCGLYIDP
jgi:hypothetical protein